MQSYAKKIIRFFTIDKDVSSAQAQTKFLDHCLDWEIGFSLLLHKTSILILQAIVMHIDKLF